MSEVENVSVAENVQGFDQWALVEVMGHKQFAGRVTEQVIAGHGFVQVSVPATDGAAGFVKLLGAGSIYAITPVAEEVARILAANMRNPPIEPWQLPKPPRLSVLDAEDEDESF